MFKLNVHETKSDREKDCGVEEETESCWQTVLKDTERGIRSRHRCYNTVHDTKRNGVRQDVEQETLERRDLEFLCSSGTSHYILIL